MTMEIREFTVRFLTPAFLGNAEQVGQWRTPPFKALLRQWWRVVYAADHKFAVNVAEMRREEGLLFGHAWLENDTFERNGRTVTTAARKSLVRMRLDSWAEGKLGARGWPRLATVAHPEVSTAVGADLYLGYGPVTLQRGERQPTLKANAAIQSGESATLSLAIPDEHAPRIERALGLMAGYGTLGGRNRNGWGSFSLTPQEGTPALNGAPLLRPWQDAFALDWPHAIGQETQPLIWHTEPCSDWRALMRELAIIKIGLRTQFVFPNVNPPHPEPLPRHWLSYPITRHTTRAFGRNARLPNSLRFKVRRALNDSKQVVGVIFHMPCLPPREFNPQSKALIAVWQSVHALLDELAKPVNSRSYGSVSDADRRAKLKPQLDAVTLKRIPE
jgi:CRISPR-associated protein Cmr1